MFDSACLKMLTPGWLVLDSHQIHRAIKDALGQGLLALQHHGVDELRNGLAVVARIGEDRCASLILCGGSLLTSSLRPLGAVLGAAWLRPFTPEASSVPRTMIAHPGRSFTRPPRTSTIECSCRCGLRRDVGNDFEPLVRRTLATLRSAEFGFLECGSRPARKRRDETDWL